MLQQIRIKIILIFICLLAVACGERSGNDAVAPGDTSSDDDQAGVGSVTDPDNEDEEIVDNCPDNPNKNDPGFCGCQVPEGACCDTIDTGFAKAIGAKYAFYAQPYSDDLGLDSLVPDDEKIVQIVRDQTIEPAEAGESFVILNGFIKIDEAGLYSYNPGYEQSTFNVMTINDQEVHRKDLGDTDGVTTEIYLAEGYHRFRIVFFKTINPLAIWQNGSRMNETHLWHDQPFAKEKEDGILDRLRALEDHINGVSVLNESQLTDHHAALAGDFSAFGISDAIMLAANELVATYESKIGPLWIGEQTKGGFNRKNEWKVDIHRIIFEVMQAIIDFVYTTEIVGKCSEILKGKSFQTSEYFPGKVTSVPDPNEVHKAKISASYPKTFGHPLMHAERPARKPTGTYLAPGTIATVTVPLSLVGKGFAIRVGAHSWDLAGRPPVQRLDRVTELYDIVARQTQIASPLGGNIYIEVPFLADEGVVDVRIQNAVRAPYFSAKSFHATNLSDWRDIERKHGAPWADFQSEKFMMNVPTSWIYNLEDPVTLMQDWDLAMDAMNDLMGYPHLGGKETMYPQVDVILRSSVHAPGYPSVNSKYSPDHDYEGNASSHLVKGPQFAPDYEFHEQGHAYLFVEYGGEMEPTVNLLHVAVWHQKFGFSLDEAFRASRGSSNEFQTLDTTAITWMTVFNFSTLKAPMAPAEKAYQLKGHAKFVDIARLFGWEVLNDFWYSINEDYENGIEWSKHGTPSDAITLRLSDKAKVDLRPLLHFWGIHPDDPSALAADIGASNLPPSAKIYDALAHYKSLVPKDNSAFQAFAMSWWGKQPSVNGYWTEREHARQWDSTTYLDRWPEPARPNGEMYTEATAADSRNRVQEIIDLYFPKGRPEFEK